jgi:hypothetical protein
MRKISCSPAAVISLLICGAISASSAQAQAQYYPGGNQSYTNQTYSYGLNLPQVPLPTGSDEVRAADGTTCKSNTASNGTYLDAGAIGSQDVGGSFNQGSVYARVIIPLGEAPKRIDCTNLYHLEIERLRSELQLIKMGASGRQAVVAEPAKKGNWQNDGWSDKGWSSKGAQPLKVGGPTERERKVAALKPAKPGVWETTVMKYVD